MKRKSIKFKNRRLYLGLDRYDNGRLAIFIQDRNEDYLDDVTINLPDIKLPNNKLIGINDCCRNSGMEQALIEAGVIKEIAYTVQYNYQEYDIAKLNIEALKEYDPEGYEACFKDAYYKKYTKEEMQKIAAEEGYIYVNTSEGALYIISKNDIADYIVKEVERQKYRVDIAMYTPSKYDEPILTTIGCYLNRINQKLREDIIERLVDLQMNGKAPKELKIFDRDEFEILDKAEDETQYNNFYKKYYEEEKELEE